MANTYSQITIQSVFVVKKRENLITPFWQDDLFKYLSGILTNQGAKSLVVGGWRDHVHLFFGMPVSKSIADLMRDVKSSSSKWINEQKFVKSKFEWQVGYGAFSYSKSQRDVVIKYILNQEEHHSKVSFREEYLELLNEFDIEFQNEYLFEFLD